MQLIMTMDNAEIRRVLADHLQGALGDGWTVKEVDLTRRKSGDFEAKVDVQKGPNQIELGPSRKYELDSLLKRKGV
jgi:hypothetical protein